MSLGFVRSGGIAYGNHCSSGVGALASLQGRNDFLHVSRSTHGSSNRSSFPSIDRVPEVGIFTVAANIPTRKQQTKRLQSIASTIATVCSTKLGRVQPGSRGGYCSSAEKPMRNRRLSCLANPFRDPLRVQNTCN